MIFENTGSTGPQEPCLVKAGQGFSVLYQQRFLYSKYAPDRAINTAIDGLAVLNQTIILAYSPCLWLGLDKLLEKCPEDCFIAGIEDDLKLFELAEKKLDELKSSENGSKYSSVCLYKSSQIEEILKDTWKFRRPLAIEMSGGVFFNKEKYYYCTTLAQNIISAFWKNRITLVKLGRLFSRNLFKNLKQNQNSVSVPVHDRAICNPVLVFGAGESTESLLDGLKSTSDNFVKLLLKKAVIVAVDAALPVLVKYGIEPDFVIGVESQLAIEKAYIGCTKTNAVFLRDLSSRPSTGRHTKGRNLFFFSEYSRGNFFDNTEKAGLLPVKIPALGSVGLTAVYLALIMRSTASVPVFIAGLDFSFSLGATHARGAPAHTARLCKTKRLTPVENYGAAFKTGAVKTAGKNGEIFTDTALSGYAALFNSFFEGAVNLFDAGKQGLKLSVPQVCCHEVYRVLEASPDKNLEQIKKNETTVQEHDEHAQKICDFISGEKSALLRLKSLLINGEKCVPPPKPSLEEEIKALLECREYLFLHFPDGYKCDCKNLSFLKRVRTEIDFFLKDFE